MQFWQSSAERFGLEVKFEESSSNRRIQLGMIMLEESIDTGKKRAKGQNQGYDDRRGRELAQEAEKA